VEDRRPRPREVEDALWNRFKAAQDAFFTARNAHFSVQDEELRGNQKVKEEILAEAETIDPSQGLDKAKARLRTLQDRWEAAGKVPRDVMRSLEDRMGAVETKIRTAGEARFARSDESPFTAKLREKVVELEVKLDKARAAGRPTEELEAALTTQRQWLAQAGGSGAPAASTPGTSASAPAKKRSTSGWVRAE
jgi:DNA repair exonuclease SbcCD ATPase subunit